MTIILTLLLSVSAIAEVGKGFSNFSEYNGELYGHWEIARNVGSPAECHGVPLNAYGVCVYNGYIYYDANDGKIHRCNLDRSNDIVITQNDFNSSHPVIHNNVLYYSEHEYHEGYSDYDTYVGTYICKQDLTTNVNTRITGERNSFAEEKNSFVDTLFVTDDYIYCQEISCDYGYINYRHSVFRMKHGSNEREYLTTIYENSGSMEGFDKVGYSDGVIMVSYNSNGSNNHLIGIDTVNNTVEKIDLGAKTVEYIDADNIIVKDGLNVNIISKNIGKTETIFTLGNDTYRFSVDTIYKNKMYCTVNDDIAMVSYGYRVDLSSKAKEIVTTWQAIGNGG